MDILYFHGGPGLNSNPEKEMLTDKFKAKGYYLKCWNEPSSLRSNNSETISPSFQDYLNSAEDFLLSNYDDKPITIIGHSFGSQACLYLSKKHAKKIKHIFLIASNLSVKDTDLNTFSFIASDLEKHNDENAKIMHVIIKKYTGKFDENTQNGFAIVGQNPRLFNYYWFKKELMDQFLSHYTAPSFVLDINAYFSIRKTWFEQDITKSSIPVTAIYGKHDSVVSNEIEQLKVKEHFNNTEFYQFDNAAHYPHIEETNLLLQLCDQKLN